jgi:hypothetical protein
MGWCERRALHEHVAIMSTASLGLDVHESCFANIEKAIDDSDRESELPICSLWDQLCIAILRLLCPRKRCHLPGKGRNDVGSWEEVN